MGGTSINPDEVTQVLMLKNRGFAISEIARRVGRCHATVVRIVQGKVKVQAAQLPLIETAVPKEVTTESERMVLIHSILESQMSDAFKAKIIAKLF